MGGCSRKQKRLDFLSLQSLKNAGSLNGYKNSYDGDSQGVDEE